MCGITGFWDFKHRLAAADFEVIAQRMADALHHRGPDAGGVWTDTEVGVALGHRRLSILDLSEAGAQPMPSASQRYWISYNGEIYNYQSLKNDAVARGYPFQGHSDTEVLLAAIELWGIEETLSRIHGMFAFAVWDRQARELVLARDRVGKKPLYYGWCQGGFLFGSELRALRQHPDFVATIDRDALGQFIQYGWLAQPSSIYTCIRKLAPGCLLRVTSQPSERPEPSAYWSAKETAERAWRQGFSGTYDDAVDRLDGQLRESVGERMIADVPLGALLSGGIDSTTIVALMTALNDRPIKTFSIGFHEERYNEAGHAAEIARFLGTDHRELYVTPEQCLSAVDRISHVYDEPFADVSQIPTYLVSALAREDVTVALSGDGGDELFCGYTHYRDVLQKWRWLSRIPRAVRSMLASAGGFVSNRAWRMVEPPQASMGIERHARCAWAGKLPRRVRGWNGVTPQDVLMGRFARIVDASDIVIGSKPPLSPLTDQRYWAEIDDPSRALSMVDYVAFLPEDILVKVDRASMAVSLEVRSPLLDTRIAPFAWSLPPDFLVDVQGGKRILKDVLARYVPRRLTDRPKRGFGVPVADWLKGPLRPWAEELLDESRLRQQGFFHVKAVRQIWHQHVSQWQNHGDLLWAILMFQAWLEAHDRQQIAQCAA